MATFLQKSVLTATVAAMATGVPAGAQRKSDPEAYYRAPSSVQGKTVVLPMGTTFEGRIESTIGSAKSRQGQTFSISVSAPVIANGTDVLIPTGSQVIGEVVEAIPADHVAHQKGYPKPIGKLRVQLTQLRTPDGVTYPLVGSLAGESVSTGTNQRKPNSAIGPSVGYVGSQSSFEAVAPGMANRMRNNNQGPKVVTKQQLMSDPILGAQLNQNQGNQKQAIRSLIHHGRELIILSGSPLTIKIDEPFKIGIAPPPSAIDALNVPTESSMTGGRRFSPSGNGGQSVTSQNGGPASGPLGTESNNPLPGILPDTPHGQTTTPPMSVPPANNQSGPGGGKNDF